MRNRLLEKLFGKGEGLAPRDSLKRFFQILMTILLIVVGFFVIALVSITVALMYTDTTGFRVDGPNFSLYKNTMLEQCSRSLPSTKINCTMIFWTRVSNHNLTDPYRWVESSEIDSPRRNEFGVQDKYGSATDDGATLYGWCDLMSCLKDYKIIPSQPRPHSFGLYGYNRFQVWGWLCVSAATGIWFVRNALISIHRPQESSESILIRRYVREHPEEVSSSTSRIIELQMAEGTCSGVGKTDWLFWIVDAGTSGLWLYSYFKTIGNRFDITLANTLAWVTPWRVTIGLFNHPFACHHPHSNRSNHQSQTRFARIITSVMAVIAVVSWILCVHLLLVGANVRRTKYPVYQCLESEILQAPGATVCSPQILCSKEKQWLFANRGWDINIDNGVGLGKKAADARYSGVFFFSSVAAWAALGFWVLNQVYFKGKWYRWDVKWRRVLNGTVVASLVYLLILSILEGTYILTEVFAYNKGSETPRQAVVAFDVNCTAAHVYMSDWRYYLDIDGFDRPTRIARTLLNS